MTTVLQYFPGQVASIFLQTLDGYGNRSDSNTLPVITRVISPNLTLICGYPVNMNRFDVGLYFSQIRLPNGAQSVGSYLVDVQFDNPADGYAPNHEIYQIIVNAPYGQFSVSAG